MLDLKFIRENPEIVKQAVAHRHDNAPIDKVIELDAQRRRKVLELDNLRRSRKETSREHKAAGASQGRDLRVMVRAIEDEVKLLDEQLKALLLQIPNVPDPSVPVGEGEQDNKIVRTWGEPKTLDFTPAPHWKLGEDLGIIDFERGVKLSGTRFYILRGLGARLQRALIWFMLDQHTRKHGYTEIYPPYMVKQETMYASGNLPKFAENLYHDAEEDYWFVPTAEVPLTSLHSGELLSRDSLPMHYVAYTACFRREKMSAGKDTRGIKRGHQFDKVELYKYTEPETSNVELDRLVNDAEDICQKLGLPYRVLQLCTAELGFASSKTFDIEMWAPGYGEWLEVSSCSNCKDFQARRANVRYRPDADAKPQYVHTLNGSGLALPRVLISVLENYQQADGSVKVPEVLRDFMGADVIKPTGA